MNRLLSWIVAGLIITAWLTGPISAQGFGQATQLTPQDRERIINAYRSEADLEKRVKLLLLLVRDSQADRETDQELRYRTELHNQLKDSSSFEKLKSANHHRIGKIHYNKGSLQEARSVFKELLESLPVSEIKIRNLTLQYLSSIASRLNDHQAEEKTLSKYVISKAKTSAFYETSGGFERLLELTEKNGSLQQHYYYSNWYEAARQNGTVADQKRILTQWVNYTTDHPSHFSDEPFERYTAFLDSQNQQQERRQLQLLHAQSTPDDSRKVAIYEEIHRQNQAASKQSELGLLTFLYTYYQKNDLDRKKQEILQILSQRSDYEHQQSALRELASVSLKNDNLLVSFNSHRALYVADPEIKTDEDLLILDNLISLSQQLSRDESLVKYLTLKALNRSPLITNAQKQQSFNILIDHFDTNRQYELAADFYDTFIDEGITEDADYPDMYKIHFKAAFIAEKAGNVDSALDLYNKSLEEAIQREGDKAELIKIAQRTLQLTESHDPGSAEFDILEKMKTIYQSIPDWEGVAKTELIIAQKHQKNDDVDEAIKAYKQALETYRKIDNPVRVSELLTLLANLEESNTGEKLNRLTDLEASLEETGNMEELVRARTEIGNYYKLQNEVEKARTYYLKAYNTSSGDKSYLAQEAGYFSALISSQQKRFAAANALLNEIAASSVISGQEEIAAQSYQLLAQNKSATGQHEEALSSINQALELAVEDLFIPLSLTQTAVLISNKRYSEALKVIQALQDKALNNRDWLTLYLYAGKANLGLARNEQALKMVNAGIGLLQPGQYSDREFELRDLKTLILRTRGEINNAISNQTQLITILQRENIRDRLGEAHLRLAELFIEAGQLTQAIDTNKVASTFISNNRILNIRMLLNIAKITRIQNNLSRSIGYFNQINSLLDQSVPKTLRADIAYQAGFTYLQVSRFDEALDNFRQSERLFQELNQPDEMLQSRLAQANVLMKQGTIKQAERIFQSALSQSESNTSVQADIYASLAFLYTELGQYNKALDNSQRAEELYRSTAQTARLPEVLNARGLIFLRMNDFGQSEVLFMKALDLNKDQNNPLLDSEITNNLGGLYKTKGELKKARTQLIKTAELQKSLGFESLLALTFNNIGSVYLEEEKYVEALDFLRQSRDFASRFDLKKELAVSWNNEGILFFKQNKTDQAENAFQNALALQRELNLKVDIARTLNNLSIIASNNQQKEKALDLLQEAIATLSLKELDPNAFYPNPPQESVLAASLMKDFLQNKGAFLRDIADQTNRPEQKNRYLEASYLSFDLSINLIEALRAQIKSEASQQLLLQANIDIYQQMIAILYELGNRTGDIGFHKKAFFYAEKSRARSFLDQLQEQAARASLKLPKEIRERENNLKSQISLVEKNIFVELSKPERERDEAKIEQWQIDKTELQIRYTQLTQELEERFPAYASLRYPTVYGVEEVKTEILDAETQIVVFFLGKDVSYGWRVSSSQFEMISLPPAADIDLLIRKYRKTLVDPLVFYDEEEELVIDATNTHLVTGLQIYRTFLEKLIGKTPASIKNLLIVPDGVLYYLPFETILVQMHSQTDKRFAKGREYLLNRYSVYYSPSTSVLGMIQTQARQRDPEKLAARREFVGFGDPRYQPPLDKRDSFDYNPTLKDLGFYDMPRLLATNNELKKISAMFSNSATTYLRDDAKESAAKQKIQGYKYIHFATHGIMDERNPEYSGVVLDLITGDSNQDGFLQAAEIFELELDSDLVVLSACETGLGKVIKGEGMVGLTRAFLYAGSPSIVVSLWSVADESTSRLMIHFYRFLNKGLEKSEALRKAKIALMQETFAGDLAYADPFFWGPFVLNGASF